MNRQLGGMQSGKRQQGVVDGAKPAASGQNDGKFELHHHVQHELFGIDRNQDATSAFDNQPIIQETRRQRDAVQIDFDASPPRREIRRDRRNKFVYFVERTISADARKAHHGDAVGAFERAGLNRLPINGVQRRAEQGSESRLADARVRAGDEEMAPHACLACAREVWRERQATSEFTSRRSSSREMRVVTERRNREPPSGTVGGRIPRTAKPSRWRCSAASSVASLWPRTTGTIWLAVAAVSKPSDCRAARSIAAR